jgi:hypothetical protein
MKKEIEWKNALPTRIGKAMKVVLTRNILREARINITPILTINLLSLCSFVSFSQVVSL